MTEGKMDNMKNYGIWLNGFHITVGDEPNFEDLTAEVCFDKKLVAHLSQEDGFENMQVEIYGEGENVVFACPLSDLMEVLARARDRLWELRRGDSEVDVG